MNLLLLFWRFVAIPISVCVYVFAVMALIPNPINLTSLLIWCAVGYLLSLSTVIRFVHGRYIYVGRGYLFLLYVAALLLNAVIFPATLLVSMFGRIYRIASFNRYEAPYDEESPKVQKRLAQKDLKSRVKSEKREQKEAIEELAHEMREEQKNEKKARKTKKDRAEQASKQSSPAKPSKKQLRRDAAASYVSETIRESMWRASSNRAVNKILDEKYQGDIRIDDGVDPKVYKQVALINLTRQKYALLAEYGEDGKPSAQATAYAIVPDDRSGNTLVQVEDEELCKKIFSVYRALLAEKRIYNE